MSEDPEDKFISQIQSTLEKNGYPEKKVSLPAEKLKTAAEKQNLDLEMILSRLNMSDIYSKEKDDKILFSSEAFPEENAGNAEPFSFDAFKDMNQDELMKKASQMMQNMNPEQMASITDAYKNMSPEEQQEILKKGSDLGIL